MKLDQRVAHGLGQIALAGDQGQLLLTPEAEGLDQPPQLGRRQIGRRPQDATADQHDLQRHGQRRHGAERSRCSVKCGVGCGLGRRRSLRALRLDRRAMRRGIRDHLHEAHHAAWQPKIATPRRAPPVVDLLARHVETPRHGGDHRVRLQRRHHHGKLLAIAPTAPSLDPPHNFAPHRRPRSLRTSLTTSSETVGCH